MKTEAGFDFDVAIAGGGPAGLAAAIACCQAGLSVAVFEKRHDDLDKACGEGLLPAALAALEELGVGPHLAAVESARFEHLRYQLLDGSSAETVLPAAGGRGVRRTALVQALSARAEELGVVCRAGESISGFERNQDGMTLTVGKGTVRCRLLVVADGLASPLRALAGLERGKPRPHGRYGLRLHFRLRPWSSAVEVHFGEGVEAYVTPVGPAAVGVAFLWSHRELPSGVDADALLGRIPFLAGRLLGAERLSRPRGAGPLERRVRRRTADRLVLIGDAAGYLDAITGEGLALAFQAALRLGRIAPKALQRGAGVAALAAYERNYARAYRRYLWLTRLVLWLSRHAAPRRWVVRWLGRHPATFRSLIAWGLKSD